ncbi:glycosyltransferase family 4 protein [Alphaproteobacteria bacterium]|nr:glycosyltransferase family 4 protein [Alphaproteobacteria bacterium]
MEIVFFTDHFVPEISAPAAHIFDRCKIWVQQGHDVKVITNVPNYPLGKPYDGYKNRPRSWEVLHGIKVLRVGTYMAENKGAFKRTIDYVSFAVSSFLNSLSLSRPDVVYSTSPHLFAPLGAIGFAFLKRTPHVVEIRDLWPDSISGTTGMSRDSLLYKCLELIEKLIYRSSSQIIVFTDSFKTALATKGVNAAKVHVVINGANTAMFSNPEYDENLAVSLSLANKFVVGYMGTHGLSHDLLNAVRAAAILRDEDIHFLFVGEGAEKSSMVRLAKELNATNIHFVGKQPREDMPNYWGLCDVGLVHLKNDTVFETVIPSKIFETMASGRPIIYCGPESDGSRLILKYESGLVAPPDNPGALARKVLELRDNKNLCASLAANGVKISPLFSRENQSKGTIDVLHLAIQDGLNKK